MPTISVVIPTYNAERTILETIASVQQQTFSDFEIIIVNDGSTDHTLELLHSVTDERVKIFSYENGGQSVARNRGIARAIGEFIAFLDADDLWTADKLELQLVALQHHPDAGVAYSWTRYIDEKGNPSPSYEPVFFEGNVYAELLVSNFIANGSNPLVRKQAIEDIGEFDPAIPPCEDWDFYIRLAARWPFVVVPKPQILYRQSSGSMSAKVEVMEKSFLTLVENAFRSAPSELQYLKNKSLANGYRYCADLYLRPNTNISMVNQAGQRLWMVICLYPRCLQDLKTQKLVLWFIKKWIKIRFFSHKNKQYTSQPQ